ncbi:MAG TPA: serine hydrolase domain-containing protein, partial [Thermoanaerobaculia bacterium]|nr:serine hydrolase domain-containing protein [Thermoanaerobaculia bacterium]
MRIALLLAFTLTLSAQTYWPGDTWETRTPAQVKMDAAKLDEAIAFAKANESKESRDLERAHYVSAFGREPMNEVVGVLRPRGDQTGIVIRHGYIVAEWGEPHRVDMTFSVAKSFLSSVVGVAVDRRLIRGVDTPVHESMAPVVDADGKLLELFESAHAKSITWDHLLRQTSDWNGTLWGKPDWADRPAQDLAADIARERHAPGTTWEYNDTRVNLLALAALNVWRKPLPQVLDEHVMTPIGASRTWRWLGYHNSWILLDGVRVQSVSGGSHWGGGMMISARDQARFGLLTLRNGRWRDRQILSESWLRAARTPTSVRADYGYMNFYLNGDRRFLPSAPADAFAHMGAGTNAIYVDPANDLVVVVRWIERGALDG